MISLTKEQDGVPLFVQSIKTELFSTYITLYLFNGEHVGPMKLSSLLPGEIITLDENKSVAVSVFNLINNCTRLQAKVWSMLKGE